MGTDADCWVIVGDDVYDVTKFLPDHPGGKKAIMLYAGKDATEEFDMLMTARSSKSMALIRELCRKWERSRSEVVLSVSVSRPQTARSGQLFQFLLAEARKEVQSRAEQFAGA